MAVGSIATFQTKIAECSSIIPINSYVRIPIVLVIYTAAATGHLVRNIYRPLSRWKLLVIA